MHAVKTNGESAKEISCLQMKEHKHVLTLKALVTSFTLDLRSLRPLKPCVIEK
jgi:hypothetical protein